MNVVSISSAAAPADVAHRQLAASIAARLPYNDAEARAALAAARQLHGSFINAASPSIPPALLQDSTTRRAALAITAWLPADAKTALRILDLVGVTVSEGDAGKPAAKRGRTGSDDK